MRAVKWLAILLAVCVLFIGMEARRQEREAIKSTMEGVSSGLDGVEKSVRVFGDFSKSLETTTKKLSAIPHFSSTEEEDTAPQEQEIEE